MIRLTSYLNGSPIYVPADVVIKENYKYELGSKNALPVTEYKPIDGAMVVYDGVEYSVKESPAEVARKVLEWKYIMQKGAYTNTQEMAILRELAGLEDMDHDEG